MEKKYYSEIDILKGFAIAMVVLGHSVIVYPVNLHEILWCRTIYDFVRIIHIPLFFLVSGYCFSYRGEYIPYIKKKIARILIPYLVFNALDLIPRMTAGALVNRPRGLGEGLYSIAVEGGAYWFLYSLFMVFLLFPALLPVLKTRRQRIAVFLLFVILKMIPSIPAVFLIKRTVRHLPYFVLGYGLRKSFSIDYLRKTVSEHKALCLWTMILFPLVIVLFCPAFAAEDSQLIALPLSFLGIISALIVSVLLKEGAIRSMLTEFGKYSLQIYLLNGFTLTASRTVLVKILNVTNPAIIISVNFLFCMFAAYYPVRYVFTRYRITRQMFGII